jgi:hypothetical protein
MFCPRCAAQNLDDAKFCRVCGTNLETVALALADKYHPAKNQKVQASLENWLDTRKAGVNKIVKGTGWLISSLLIGVALGIFSNEPDWIVIWMCLVGWMTVLGVISMVTGIAGLMESRFIRRQLGEPTGASHIQIQPLPSADRAAIKGPTTAPMLAVPPSSITEHTTTRLIKPETQEAGAGGRSTKQDAEPEH